MSNLNDFNREAKAALWVALQWLLLAVPTGLVCGAVGTAFHLSVEYVTELAGENPLTPVQYWTGERTGRDREDKEDYRVKLGVALCFSNRVNITEYYHNSSFLEHGGSPERAVKVALVNQIDAWLKNNNKYLKNESKISFQDVQDCLVYVSSSFSTRTSYCLLYTSDAADE
mgnify:CR=1 FL=1